MFNSDTNRYVHFYSENKGKLGFHYETKQYVNFYSKTKGCVKCFLRQIIVWILSLTPKGRRTFNSRARGT